MLTSLQLTSPALAAMGLTMATLWSDTQHQRLLNKSDGKDPDLELLWVGGPLNDISILHYYESSLRDALYICIY